MSAVNVICGSRRACVLTDASLYDGSGTIVAFALKAHAVDSWNGVITGRGANWGSLYAAELAETFGSFDEFVSRSAPVIETAHRAALAEWMSSDVKGQSFIEVHVIGWSERRDRPEAYVLCSPSAFLDAEEPTYVWRSLEEEGGIFHCAHLNGGEMWQLHRQSAEEGVDWTVETFDPVRHGIPLMEAQRRQPADTRAGEGAAGKHVIGGELWLTVVDREGVRQGVIHEWPDRVGEPIRPAPLDEGSLPKVPPSGLGPSWPFERFDRAVKAGVIDFATFDFDPAALARLEAAAPPGAGLSRQQRRAAKAQARKGGLARV
ncbi:hypothetical protein Q8W71_06890 [Methylobacterium sp. NEAU 140]|uniref:hypothetical protein n=1 Tax=Methylobacterium sp. NEAU 140 TaxID=3064945 RepID=UPI0027354D4F|nr:hypothetical protein [Methylobacterium sp. NEAU 140]MDP4022343.1 hypothetical protein [Methylobacterium sp. NEAU 140]